MTFDSLLDRLFAIILLYCNLTFVYYFPLLILFLLSSQGGGEAPWQDALGLLTRRVTSLSKHNRLDLGGPPPVFWLGHSAQAPVT